MSIPFRESILPSVGATICGMDAKEARTANIRLWVKEVGGPAAFGARTRWSKDQASQWTSQKNPKPIGHRLARDIEQALGKRRGEMDAPPGQADLQSQSVLLDLDRLGVALTAIDKALADVELQGKLGKLDDAIQFAYAEAFELENPKDKAQRNLLDKLVAERLRDWSGRESKGGVAKEGKGEDRGAAASRKEAGRGR